jgi:hypothetical protein
VVDFLRETMRKVQRINLHQQLGESGGQLAETRRRRERCMQQVGHCLFFIDEGRYVIALLVVSTQRYVHYVLRKSISRLLVGEASHIPQAILF